ncbi:putative 2-oxoglutarate dehydrogenase E1 component DHKTD1, mitochondrial [Portunus trituberculatus]|uniref:Putative 2-oxoglutarate dehydrogenase E1 component DHKTD1, mitochondrial n=1 Tax=Portunus trituberculatus TaxID=210409 RepID=A0A5B7F4D2_PORTR|nr:putative 2-oxoglutarate dehydrogenase E1 component DHKTD1, mitochondrial [Portunus trituberculatus]
MNVLRTVEGMAGLRRAMSAVYLKSVPCGRVADLCPVTTAVVGCVRAYQSYQGVYGYKYREPRGFTCELCNGCPPSVPDEVIQKRKEESCLFRWISAFREFGHLTADVNPLSPNTRQVPELEPGLYGLNCDALYNPCGLVAGCDGMYSLQQLQDILKQKYCGHMSVEFSYLPTLEEREWFANAVESLQDELITPEERIRLAGDMLRSQAFDNFLGTKFQSVKRYGAEGGESTVGFFSEVFRRVAQDSVEQVVIGIAHRGRLNLLTGLLQYPASIMFRKMKGLSEFPESVKFIGDALSHLAISLDMEMEGDNSLHVTMLPNPSHLEAVNPVACGKTRARQRSLKEGYYSTNHDAQPGDKVVCLQVHGDAALGGQGVNQETLSLSSVPHFDIGGALHLAINNQIGYTTPGERTRSSEYCTDVAKMCGIPVIHVNGDQPERLIGGEEKESSERASVSEPHPSTSGFTVITPDVFMDGDLSSYNLPTPPHPSSFLFYVIHHQPSLTAVVKAARLAVQYQRKFRRDVFVDLLCWRRWGHNELDNPRFTNPTMYHVIDARRCVCVCVCCIYLVVLYRV